MLSHILHTTLYDEMTVLYARLKQHKEVLKVTKIYGLFYMVLPFCVHIAADFITRLWRCPVKGLYL